MRNLFEMCCSIVNTCCYLFGLHEETSNSKQIDTTYYARRSLHKQMKVGLQLSNISIYLSLFLFLDIFPLVFRNLITRCFKTLTIKLLFMLVNYNVKWNFHWAVNINSNHMNYLNLLMKWHIKVQRNEFSNKNLQLSCIMNQILGEIILWKFTNINTKHL